jgi:hypothetical protein
MTQIKENWEIEFDKKFSPICPEDKGLHSWVTLGDNSWRCTKCDREWASFKDFIQQTIDQSVTIAVEEFAKKVLNQIKSVKYNSGNLDDLREKVKSLSLPSKEK